MLNDYDIEEYWERVKSYYNFDDNYKNFVNYLVGSHPWLMDVVNDYYYEHKNDTLTSEEKCDGVKLNLMKGLDGIVSVLEKENLLDAAIQIIIGPLFNVNQIQIEKLLQYGFIQRIDMADKKSLFGGNLVGPIVDNYCYKCFSDFSTFDLYRRYYANVPYVAVWSDTEKKLRQLIIRYLTEKYTANWITDMRTYLVNNKPFAGFNITIWDSNIVELKNNMSKMISDFPTMRGKDIVEFTLTSQLFDIFINVDWNWFGRVFTGDQNEWRFKFKHLKKVRNPVAHNNFEGIAEDMDLARQYCDSVLKAIAEWESKQQP